ncbi:MAG: acetyl-CoA C-acetyltransferase [Deltaproteobacteria bacterium]|nr:acetyl-CoA C-acetyltransferase [Deltaproteobacteria bacterium]
MEEVVIVSAVRTAIGAFNGALSNIPATTLGAWVINEAIRRAGISDKDVDEVIMGNVLPAGLGQNPARQASLKAKLPFESGAITVNKVCGSGLKAVMLAAQAIQTGDADVVVAGGMENMNLAPYYLERARTGYRMGDGKVVDGLVHDGLWDLNNDFHMGYSAELCAGKYGISREEQDRYAFRSYQRSLKSIAEGKFRAEIFPVEIPAKKGAPVLFQMDEAPRETSLEALSALPPAFGKDGSVTAGNSSKISDGAAALVLMSLSRARQMKNQSMVRIVAKGAAGIDPKYVLVAPIYSIPKVLKKAGLKIEDIDLHEVNEAFASSTLAVIKELRIDLERCNVRGGSISLGHPIGASGARVLTTLIYAMEEYRAKRGMASLCLGGGEAVSLIVEKM